MKNHAGTISVTGPKISTREALLNERARDINWIDRLITESEDPAKVEFKPDLVREVEQITAFSAALGLKFDPAAAVNYKRAQETGDIQQDINVLKLQLQLDQLRRDAELVRAKLPDITEPANAGLGKLADGTVVPAAATTTVSAVDQLRATVDKLTTALATRLDAEGKPTAVTTVKSSPIEDFRDRSAYRDVLKAARNAAVLDELHDIGGAKLVRLNFVGHVVPDPTARRSLGVIQMSVMPPQNDAALQDLLKRWLIQLNLDRTYRVAAGAFGADPTINGLLARGDFRVVRLGGIEMIAPILQDMTGAELDPSLLLPRAEWAKTEGDDSASFGEALGLLATQDPDVTVAIEGGVCSYGAANADAQKVLNALKIAIDRQRSIDLIALANAIAAQSSQTLPGVDVDSKRERSAIFLQSAVSYFHKRRSCIRQYRDYARDFSAHSWALFSTPAFAETNAVRIYEVGPREQVQRVSTVARAASSLSLAATAAVSAPGSGAAAEAAASFAKQAIGRASTLERNPTATGYSVTGRNTFGWVIGPRAIVDAKGKVRMAQPLGPYDLSVDMSVPGWWPAMSLNVETKWGPSPAQISSGQLTSDDSLGQAIIVPLTERGSEFASLTKFLLGDRSRRLNIKSVDGGPVNACTATTLIVRGEEVFRADKVALLGQLIGAEQIKMMPDMQGILVTVPPITPLAEGNLPDQLTVMTPLGIASTKITYVSSPSGDGCKPSKPAASVDPTAPTISEIKPDLDFFLPGVVTLDLKGTNLAKVVSVKLNGTTAGVLAPAADGKLMKVTFDLTSSVIPPSDNIELSFAEKDKPPFKTARVRIRR